MFCFFVWRIFWIFRIFPPQHDSKVPQEDLRVHVHVAPSTATLKLRWRSTPRRFSQKLPRARWVFFVFYSGEGKCLVFTVPSSKNTYVLNSLFFAVVTDFVLISPRIFCLQTINIMNQPMFYLAFIRFWKFMLMVANLPAIFQGASRVNRTGPRETSPSTLAPKKTPATGILDPHSHSCLVGFIGKMVVPLGWYP